MNGKIKLCAHRLNVLIIAGLSIFGAALPPKIAQGSAVVTAQNGPPPPRVTGSQTNTTFSATPTSGQVPFTVNFKTSPAVPPTNTINFGDGTTGIMNAAPTCAICATLSVTGHTYTSAGTYTATLLDSSGTVLGTATITVSQR